MESFWDSQFEDKFAAKIMAQVYLFFNLMAGSSIMEIKA
jgi:hypothetical protein